MKKTAAYLVDYFLPAIKHLVDLESEIRLEEQARPINLFFTILIHSDPDRFPVYRRQLINLSNKYHLRLTPAVQAEFAAIYQQTHANTEQYDLLITDLICQFDDIVLNRLFFAALYAEDIDTMKKCMAFGFQLDCIDYKTGLSALASSLLYTEKRTFYFLLANNPSLTMQDEFGKTILHYAAGLADTVVIKILLMKGRGATVQREDGERIAWLDIKDEAGKTASDYVTQSAVRELLIDHANAMASSFHGLQSLLLSLITSNFDFVCAPWMMGYLIDPLFEITRPSIDDAATASAARRRFSLWQGGHTGENYEPEVVLENGFVFQY